MPQFILKIDLGNGVTKTGDAIGATLEKTGEKIRKTGKMFTGKIRDINGNVVGHYEVVD